MFVDAPKDPLLTYDPTRASILKPLRDQTLLDTAIQQAPPAEGAADMPRREPVESGGFRLTEPLAQGGLGDVWVGVQRSLDRVVAIKRLREDRLAEASLDQRERLEEMFRQEALTTARLEHPNIVPVYALGADPLGQALLGMKLVRGQPWDELVKEDAGLPVEQFLARHLPILIQVAQAVAYAHSEGVLHRDIKPQQVMVGKFGEVLLMDWGLAIPFAEPADEGGADSSPPAGSGVVTIPGPAGTPSFMAPEQAQGQPEDLGPWTDLFLLGGTLYFLLTGTPPHRARNGLAAMAKAARGELEPPQERVPERKLPEELCRLTLGVMAERPEDRDPRTVTEFIEALQAYLSGATRRRQSRLLAKEVKEQLDSSRCGVYSEFSHSLSRLRQAETLWPENPQVAQLREIVLGDYSEAALIQGDLALARVQAVRLPEGRYRSGLLGRIDRALERQRTSERQRRQAQGAMVVLGVLLLLGGLHYGFEQRKAAERLRHERDAARAARSEAEGLMTFMLEDLWSGLMSIERTDLLMPVARRAAGYYAAREVAELSPTERLNRARAFTTVADALHLQGDTQEAIEIFRRALEEFGELLAAAPGDQERLVSYVTTSNALAWALNDVGHWEGALATYDQVEELCRRWLEENPGDLEVMSLLLNVHDGAGIVLYDRGDLVAAGERFQRAARLGHEVLRRDPSFEVHFALLNAEFHHGVVLMDTDHPAKALVEFERALEISKDGPVPENSPDLALLRIIRARALAVLGRVEEGLEALHLLTPYLERRLQEDPANAERRYLLTQLELERGKIEDFRGRKRAARASWQRVVDLVKPIRETTDHHYLLDSQVRALFYLGRVEEARPVAEKLLARGWTHDGFVELCGLHGVATANGGRPVPAGEAP